MIKTASGELQTSLDILQFNFNEFVLWFKLLDLKFDDGGKVFDVAGKHGEIVFARHRGRYPCIYISISGAIQQRILACPFRKQSWHPAGC